MPVCWSSLLFVEIKHGQFVADQLEDDDDLVVEELVEDPPGGGHLEVAVEVALEVGNGGHGVAEKVEPGLGVNAKFSETKIILLEDVGSFPHSGGTVQIS